MVDSILKNVFGDGSVWFWGMAQAIIVGATGFLIYRQIRLARYANMLDTLDRLDSKWRSLELIRARHDICNVFEKGDADNKKITFREAHVLDFFEDMGLFLRRGVLDGETVWESYSYSIEHYWQLTEPRITEFRTATKDRTWYTNFEYLFQKIAKTSSKKRCVSGKTQEELRKFAIGEMDRLQKTQNDRISEVGEILLD